MYVRKTVDTWVLEGNYGFGWEHILTEYTRKEGGGKTQRVQRESTRISGETYQKERKKGVGRWEKEDTKTCLFTFRWLDRFLELLKETA